MDGVDVVVNVYDLSPHNNYLHCVGLGFYHTGVEVRGREYTFSDEGVIAHRPRAVQQKYRQSITIGRMESSQEISAVVRALREEFCTVRAECLLVGADYVWHCVCACVCVCVCV